MTANDAASPQLGSTSHRPISCVIIAYHRPAPLGRLLRTLAHDDIQIVIVNIEDDARIRSFAGADIIPVATNVGYAAGVNIGVEHSAGDVVVFMNDDIEASSESIIALAKRIRDGHVDVTVPLVEDSSGEPWLMKHPPFRLVQRVPLKHRTLSERPQRIDAAWGAIVAARAEVIRAAPLPEEYFLYWEEIEWFYRLRQRDVRVEFLPAVRVRHLGGDQFVRPDKSRLIARNAVRLVRRTRGRGAALRVWPYVIAWQVRLLLTSIVHRDGIDALRGHWAGV